MSSFLIESQHERVECDGAIAALNRLTVGCVLWLVETSGARRVLPIGGLGILRLYACECAYRVVVYLGDQQAEAREALDASRKLAMGHERQRTTMVAARQTLRPIARPPLANEALSSVLAACRDDDSIPMARDASEHAAFAKAMADTSCGGAVCWMMEREWQEDRLRHLFGCLALQPA